MVATWWLQNGYKCENCHAEEIASQFGHFSYAQVYAALTHYHANREEIEAAIAEDAATGDQAEAEWYRDRISNVEAE